MHHTAQHSTAPRPAQHSTAQHSALSFSRSLSHTHARFYPSPHPPSRLPTSTRTTRCTAHRLEGLFPGLARELDIPDLVSMRCPLPSLVQHSDADPLFTLAAAQEALASTKHSFTKAGFADNFVGSVYKGGHKFDLEMQDEAYAWFDQWLMPAGSDTALAALHEKVAVNAGAELQRLEAARAELDKQIAALKM